MQFRTYLSVLVLILILASASVAGPIPMEEMVRRIRGNQNGSQIYDRHPGIHVMVEFGVASWYGCPIKPETVQDKALRLKDRIYPAAHKTLPFGTLVKVINSANGRKILCRIIDRGPYIAGRIIDLDEHGAKALGLGGISKVAIKIFAGQPNLYARR